MKTDNHTSMLDSFKRLTLILSLAVLWIILLELFPIFEHWSQFCHARSDNIPRNISAAIKSLRNAAERGDAEAQLKLGLLYFNGQGVSKDYTEALKWWKKAAEQGSPEAQFTVGVFHFNGLGTPKDSSEAARWWKKAADQGMVHAQHRLGNLYFEGNGVSKDMSEAKRLWTKAADGGNTDAQRNLAILNSKSDVAVQKSKPTPNTEKTNSRHQLIDKSESFNAPSEKSKTEVKPKPPILKRRGEVDTQALMPTEAPSTPEDKSSSDQISEDIKLRLSAAENGDAEAQYELGLYYYKGEGVSKDYSEAMKWYRKAADQGHAKAQYNIGVMYENGRGVAPNRAESRKWYQSAAYRGLAEAEYAIGEMYYKGEGTTKNLAEARKWLQYAADQGNISAINRLKNFEQSSSDEIEKGFSSLRESKELNDQNNHSQADEAFKVGRKYTPYLTESDDQPVELLVVDNHAFLAYYYSDLEDLTQLLEKGDANLLDYVSRKYYGKIKILNKGDRLTLLTDKKDGTLVVREKGHSEHYFVKASSVKVVEPLKDPSPSSILTVKDEFEFAFISQNAGVFEGVYLSSDEGRNVHRVTGLVQFHAKRGEIKLLRRGNKVTYLGSHGSIGLGNAKIISVKIPGDSTVYYTTMNYFK